MDADRAAELLTFAEATSPELTGPDSKSHLAAIDERYAQIVEAIGWLADTERPDDGLRLANAMYRYWITKRQFSDGLAGFERALAARGGDDRLRGLASVNAGFMPFWTGDDDRAHELFSAGREIGERLGDQRISARALGGLIRVALRSDVRAARRLALEALAAAEAARDEAGTSDALHLLGVGANIEGDLVEAQRWMRRRLALVRAGDNEMLVSSEAANLSMVERQLGNLDDAESLGREALEIAERRGDEFMKPFSLSGLAAIATDRGHHDRAAVLVGAAEAMIEAQGAEWPPDERPQYERTIALVPAAMGREAFERRRAEGRSMTADDAVALAVGRVELSAAPDGEPA